MRRWLWIFMAFVLGAAGAVWFWPRGKSAAPSAVAVVAPTEPARLAVPPAQASVMVSAPVQATTAQPEPAVDIQEGKTIDFSSGRPVMRDTVDDKAVMDAALREMEDAAKDVSFGPAAGK